MKGVALGASNLQVRNGMWFLRKETRNTAVLRPTMFTSKSLTSVGTHNSNIEREALGIFHGLENFITTASPTKSA